MGDTNRAEKVFRYLQPRMVSLRVSSESNRAACYVYTGFILEFEETWLWVTAAHVLDLIEEEKKRFPDLHYQWSPWSSLKDQFVAVAYNSFEKIDIGKEIARGTKHKRSRSIPDSERIDVGLIELDSYWKGLLLNVGAKAIPGPDAGFEFEDFHSAAQQGWSCFVAGAPRESHSYSVE